MTKLGGESWTITAGGKIQNIMREPGPVNLVEQKIIGRTIVEVVENEKKNAQNIENRFSEGFLELMEKYNHLNL